VKARRVLGGGAYSFKKRKVFHRDLPRWGCRVWEKNTMQLAVQNENGRLWAMR
jgi:hypothetical protein